MNYRQPEPYAGTLDHRGGEVEFSVVMPCLNEARTVGLCVTKALAGFERAGVIGEVVVADNGSSDGSPEIARAEGGRVVNVACRGYGNALRAGIESARGRYIIMGDADDSYDFGHLQPFVDRLRVGDDLVMGNRFRGGIRPGAMPFLHRWVGNPVLTGLLNLFFHTPVGDAHCGLRGIRKDAYNRLSLTCPGMEFASEMVVKAALCRARISEVPIVLYPDGRDRRPHLRTFRDGWRHLRLLLMFCPRWLFLIPAISLMVVGLAWAVWGVSTGDVTARVTRALPGLLGILVGYQAYWSWICSRQDRTSVTLESDRGRLERGLVVGGALSIVGLGMLAGAAWVGWSDRPPRLIIGGITALAIGVQTVFASFLREMVAPVERNTEPAEPPKPASPGSGCDGSLAFVASPDEVVEF